ncbi:MAG: pantoate--beta-alanine ligase [Anaerolineales bacterium]|nr:pantoate--beta-alanine ligase [Anaerolineales bacterium]
MKVVQHLEDLRIQRDQLQGVFGLVPTMGFLHEGHLSLVRRAKQSCDHVGVSIYVNPTQFSPEEDLSSYPRDLDHDLELLEREGVNLVWTPTDEQLYPAGFSTWVDAGALTQKLEGAYRPTHFRGVTTIVAKLFLAFTPDVAVFGQKDAQQAVVIQRMVRDLNFPLEVVVAPIVREADGLAMSSRNIYLNPDERSAAVVLNRSLREAEKHYAGGERDADALRAVVLDVLAGEPLARVQYVSVAHPETLDELHGSISSALASMAVYFGKTRLIDNTILG